MVEANWMNERDWPYQEAEVESDDDGVGDGEGGEFDRPEVASKGLRDDVHRVGGDPAEDRWPHDLPELLRLDP